MQILLQIHVVMYLISRNRVQVNILDLDFWLGELF